MANRFDGLSPGSSPENRSRVQDVIDLWNAVDCQSDAGETTPGVRELRAQVTECLSRVPPDLKKAERLTAKAALLLAGYVDL
jgi:hypothetical protein